LRGRTWADHPPGSRITSVPRVAQHPQKHSSPLVIDRQKSTRAARRGRCHLFRSSNPAGKYTTSLRRRTRSPGRTDRVPTRKGNRRAGVIVPLNDGGLARACNRGRNATAGSVIKDYRLVSRPTPEMRPTRPIPVHGGPAVDDAIGVRRRSAGQIAGKVIRYLPAQRSPRMSVAGQARTLLRSSNRRFPVSSLQRGLFPGLHSVAIRSPNPDFCWQCAGSSWKSAHQVHGCVTGPWPSQSWATYNGPPTARATLDPRLSIRQDQKKKDPIRHNTDSDKQARLKGPRKSSAVICPLPRSTLSRKLRRSACRSRSRDATVFSYRGALARCPCHAKFSDSSAE